MCNPSLHDRDNYPLFKMRNLRVGFSYLPTVSIAKSVACRALQWGVF